MNQDMLGAISVKVDLYFRENIGVEVGQYKLWRKQMREMRALLRSVYGMGVKDGLTATGIKGRQFHKLYDELTSIPDDFDPPPQDKTLEEAPVNVNERNA